MCYSTPEDSPVTSSCVTHHAGAWTTDAYLVSVYVVGLLTSIINHGLTSEWYKWGDRLWMAYGCTTDLLYILRIHDGPERHFLIAFQALYIGM